MSIAPREVRDGGPHLNDILSGIELEHVLVDVKAFTLKHGEHFDVIEKAAGDYAVQTQDFAYGYVTRVWKTEITGHCWPPAAERIVSSRCTTSVAEAVQLHYDVLHYLTNLHSSR